MGLVNGLPSLQRLPDLPGDDYSSLKGDLWKLSLKNFFRYNHCVKISDIKYISIAAGSRDGWNVDSVITFGVVNKNVWAQTSADLDIYHWFDYDSPPIEFLLSLKADVIPSYTCIRYLYLMAYTSGVNYAGSDESHVIELKVKGSTYRKTLLNLPGDDYSPLKGDLWKLDLRAFFGVPSNACVKRADIEGIALLAGSSDEWNIDSVFTYAAYDNQQHQLTSVDLDVYRWLDTDSLPAYKHFQLTLV